MMNHEGRISRKIDAFFGLLIIIAALAVLTLFALLTGYGASLLNWLPFLLLLSCPLIHFLMHGGHAHGAESGEKKKP